MHNVKAALKIATFAVISIIIAPIQFIVLSMSNGHSAYFLPQLWHKIICFIFRIKITHIGKPHTKEQIIFVANHLSYLDIPALGSILKAPFVAKKEVASWPVFGFLSKLQQTAFISRSHIDARKEKNALDTMIENGKSLIIFPEGTSTDGHTVIPFKSSLFAIALRGKQNDIKIQPITIVMHKADNHYITTQKDRDIYAWHINMTTPLDKHLWRFAQSKGAEIHIYFHDPIDSNRYSDRKTLAKVCHEAVSNGLTSYKNQTNKQKE